MTEIKWNTRKYSREDFIDAWNNSSSIAGCARLLGLTIFGQTYTTLRRSAQICGLTDEHMTGQGWNKIGQPLSKAIPLSDILIENSTYSHTSNLKDRLWKAGLLERKCYACGIGPEWNGLPLSLQLDHINGVRSDNRIENLRILCPNCHSQTETFAGKGRKSNGAVMESGSHDRLKIDCP